MGYPQQPYGQQPSGPQPYGYGPPSGPQAPPRKTNGLSVAALVLGLVGFISCGFTSILAIIFGHVALGQIRRDHTDGRGMALAGVILGWVLTGSWLLFWGLSWTGAISTALYSTVAPMPTVERSQLQVPAQPGDTDAPAVAGGQQVVLEAVGSDGATSAGNITYSTGNGLDLQLKQEQGAAFPYSKELSLEDPYPIYLWVQNSGDKGSITCRIKVGGQVVREAKADGPFGVCTVRAEKP